MSAENDDCPICGEDSGVIAGFDTMDEKISCKSCSALLVVEFEENADSYFFWLTPAPTKKGPGT